MENISVAICAAECLKLDPADIVRGVNNAAWPGRLERIGQFLLDGAHNPEGVAALAESLPEILGERRPVVAAISIGLPRRSLTFSFSEMTLWTRIEIRLRAIHGQRHRRPVVRSVPL